MTALPWGEGVLRHGLDHRCPTCSADPGEPCRWKRATAVEDARHLTRQDAGATAYLAELARASSKRQPITKEPRR